MPDWISRTLGRVLRSREWTNSSSDKAMVVSSVVYRPELYKTLRLLDVDCLPLPSLFIIPQAGRMWKGSQIGVAQPKGGEVLVCSSWSSVPTWGREVTGKPSLGQTAQVAEELENRQETVGKALFVLPVAAFPLTLK